MPTQKHSVNKKNFIVVGLLLIVGLVGVLFVFLTNRTPSLEKVESTQLLMDTPVTITLYGENSKELSDLKRQGFETFQEIDNLSTRYNLSEGNVAWINQNSGQPLTIDPQLSEQIQRSLYFSQQSNGVFNIALGPLIDLWKQKEVENQLPTATEIQQALDRGNMSGINLNQETHTLQIPKDMTLDLGAVSKGYAIETTAQQIQKEQKTTGIIINGGGNIKTFGTPPNKDIYRIGIQSPTKGDALLGTTTLKDNEAISTSGDYQRFYTIDGVKYSHIFSPKTGFPPAENHAVSVITENAMDADILSTILYILPKDQGLALIKELPIKVEALWVSMDHQITKTEGFSFTFDNQEGLYHYENK